MEQKFNIISQKREHTDLRLDQYWKFGFGKISASGTSVFNIKTDT